MPDFENVRALSEEHERVVRQFKAIPVPTYTYRWNGRQFVLIAYNDAADRLTGGAVAALIGKTADEINPGRPDLRQNLAECLRGRTLLEREIEYTPTVAGEDASEAYPRSLVANYAYAPPDMVVVHVTDITEQRRTEAALRAANEQLRRLVDASPLAIAVFDRDGKVKLWNRASERLFGWTAEEVMGQHAPAIPAEVAEEHARRYATLVAGRPAEFEGPRRRKDGSEIFIRSSAAPLFDDAGRVEGVIAVTADITAQHRAAVARDEFVATVSHELRTPLNAILGWTRMLAVGGISDPEKQKRALAVIQQNAERQAQLIEDLLDMSRIIRGTLRLDVAPITRLADVVAAAVETIRPSAAAKQVELQIVAAADAGPVLGDAGRLQQVAWNLLSNAVKFTQPGGTISVVLTSADGRAVLSVRDTGAGIAPEFLPHVFERFRQADSSSTRAVAGMGLGLAIAREIVQMHAGTIEARSDGLGRGATFVVTLPLMAEGADAGPAAVTQRLDPAALAGTVVVVVDDDADSREVIAEMLRQAGATVHACASAEEALATVRRAPTSVLLSDLAMPGFDGVALLQRLRDLPLPHGVPVVAVTGYAFPDDRGRLLALGFSGHLVKPLDPAELVATIRAAMRG